MAKKTKARPAAKAKKVSRPANKASAAKSSKTARSSKAAKSASKPRQAKPARATAMFQKIAFTMLGVTDAERARAFYEDVLGLRRGLAAANGMWTEYDLPGGGCLALFCHPDPAYARAPGGASVAFEVADLDSLNERLTAAGVSYQGPLIHGPNCRMSNILDSEGNSLILHQLNRA